MRTEEYTLISKDDVQTQLHGVHYIPDKEPTAAVMIAHGMQEYIERYEPLAKYLTKKGIAVMGHDHIGHGGSVASPAELGIMHTSHAAQVMMEDMFSGFTYMKSLYPNVPGFILGHSLGSYLLRMLLSEKTDALKGLTGAIVMGTGMESSTAISAARSVLHTLALMHGWEYQSERAERFMVSHIAGKTYDATGTDPSRSWLTKDEEIVKAYAADEKCSFLFSLNGYMAILDAAEYTMQKSNIEKTRKSLPILFISGAEDPVGQFGKGVKEVAKMYKRAGVEHVALRLYAGDRHEILNETDRTQVYKDIFHWMKKGL